MADRKSASKMKRKAMNGKQAKATMAPKKLPNFKDPLSKGATINAISDLTGLSRKEVDSVLSSFRQVIEKHVKTGGPGKFVMPGLLKITVVKKPARPARKGKNPFTGEEIMLKAKPASRAVKIRALKQLKEMVA